MTMRVDAEASCDYCRATFPVQLYSVVWADTTGMKASLFDDGINMVHRLTCEPDDGDSEDLCYTSQFAIVELQH